MPNGHIVLVTTNPLQGGEPVRTVYYVAEKDADGVTAIIAEILAPNEEAEALAVLDETVMKVLGLKQGDFKRAELPRREVDRELTEAIGEHVPSKRSHLA
jgi:hypothetical protein